MGSKLFCNQVQLQALSYKHYDEVKGFPILHLCIRSILILFKLKKGMHLDYSLCYISVCYLLPIRLTHQHSFDIFSHVRASFDSEKSEIASEEEQYASERRRKTSGADLASEHAKQMETVGDERSGPGPPAIPNTRRAEQRAKLRKSAQHQARKGIPTSDCLHW